MGKRLVVLLAFGLILIGEARASEGVCRLQGMVAKYKNGKLIEKKREPIQNNCFSSLDWPLFRDQVTECNRGLETRAELSYLPSGFQLRFGIYRDGETNILDDQLTGGRISSAQAKTTNLTIFDDGKYKHVLESAEVECSLEPQAALEKYAEDDDANSFSAVFKALSPTLPLRDLAHYSAVIAAKRDSIRVAQTIFDLGFAEQAYLNRPGYGKLRSPLSFFDQGNNPRVLALLASRFPEYLNLPSDGTTDFQTPLHDAIDELRLESVKVFLDAGADPNWRVEKFAVSDPYYRTFPDIRPLCLAVLKRSAPIQDLLLARGVDASRTCGNDSMLQAFLRSQRFKSEAAAADVARFTRMLAAGARIEPGSVEDALLIDRYDPKFGWGAASEYIVPYWIGGGHDFRPMLRAVLAAGANPDGGAALHSVADRPWIAGQLDIMEILLRAGADPRRKAYSYYAHREMTACELGDQDSKELLARFGGCGR